MSDRSEKTNASTKNKRPYRKLKILQELPDFSSLPEICSDAALILKHAHLTASALFKAYQLLRRRRPGQRGMTTDEEQDLLRAMLVMTAAGLDGMAKQLVRDTLPVLIPKQTEARKGLRRFIASQLLATGESSKDFMSDILSTKDHFHQVIERYINDLTGGSLQSVEEILSTAAAFGVSKDELGINVLRIKQVFAVRNTIIHELDMNLSGARRKRNLRREKDMKEMVESLFGLSSNLIQKVGEKLQNKSWLGAPHS